MAMKLQINTMVDISHIEIAKLFSEMDDDEQAKFFCEVARIAKAWGPGDGTMQWMRIGRHLGTCECSTDEGRDMIRTIAESLESSEAPKITNHAPARTSDPRQPVS